MRLVLAGPDGWGTDQLDAALAAAVTVTACARLGFVPRRTERDLLAGAAVVAVPSFYEGFGLAAAEAMLAGAPVVASDAGSHREVVGDAGLLVPAGDRDALAGALARVLGDEAARRRPRRRGPVQAGALTLGPHRRRPRRPVPPGDRRRRPA